MSKILKGIQLAEASPETTFNVLKGLKTYQVVIFNNYYAGKYSDYRGRYYYVLAHSPEEARQVVLDNADGILQELLTMKSHNGKKILPRGSAVRITPERIGKIEDGTEAGRMSTAGFKKMFGPQGPMMVKLSGGNVVDIQGQEQGVAEGHDYDDDYSDFDYRDEIAQLENQIKYTKSEALRYTLYKQLENMKRKYGVEIEDDEYYGDFDDEGHRIDDEGYRIDKVGNRIEETKEADYGDDYQQMVQRVGQKAKEQEKKKPVDMAALARRLNQPEKKNEDALSNSMGGYSKYRPRNVPDEVTLQGRKSNILKGLTDVDESFGNNYPGTYEEENAPFKKKGAYRITAMTSENKK